MDTFTNTYGTYICRKLIKECDLTSEEGQKDYTELDLKNKVCKQCISTAVQFLEDTL